MEAKGISVNDADAFGFSDLGLFTGRSQLDHFPRMAQLLASVTMEPSSHPRPWPVGPSIKAPDTFNFGGGAKSFEETFTSTETAALLLLHQGEIRYERYALTCAENTPWISMSVAKSFVSALVGIAIADGDIRGIDDPISDYIATGPGSAYAGVPIRDVLLMSSGARWNEDYSDPTSDALRLADAMSRSGSLADFVAGSQPENPPGAMCRYNSADTQALGLLLRKATGRGLADYMQEKLCEPLGMTNPSAWLTDAQGVEAAFACLNMTARDFARLGELYRNGGRVAGTQVVPAQWVHDSTRVTADQCEPGRAGEPDHPLGIGYGYQWWIPPGDDGEYTAVGVYNQFVYVDPKREVVMVKLSANRRYGLSETEADNREEENGAFLQALARQVDHN
jgi:CubicO group peptidase (beta-lactamase class C family)